ncbi:carbohydrate binding domain-containing protein [Hirsutella rhossiliensis]
MSHLLFALHQTRPFRSLDSDQRYAPPKVISPITQWKFHGCYKNNHDKRTFHYHEPEFHYDDMTPHTCVYMCQRVGFKYAGLESGRECYCGSQVDLNRKSVVAATRTWFLSRAVPGLVDPVVPGPVDHAPAPLCGAGCYENILR